MEHDITTAPAVVEHDTTDVVATAHDITDVAAPERDSTATPAAASDGHAPRPVSYMFVPPNVWALARAVAVVLDETMPPPIRTITRVVDCLGPDRARAVLGQALTVEAQGGLTLPDGHRRTAGGVFFHLVRTSNDISREDKSYIFPPQGGRSKSVSTNPRPFHLTFWLTTRSVVAKKDAILRPPAVARRAALARAQSPNARDGTMAVCASS